MVQTIGESLSSVQAALVFRATENTIAAHGKNDSRRAVQSVAQTSSFGIASAARGSIYVVAEEELEQDVELNAVDELYRGVGLRRTRQVLAGLSRNKEEPIGAAIAYRGPLGLNFSYLENRWRPAAAPNSFRNRKFRRRRLRC